MSDGADWARNGRTREADVSISQRDGSEDAVGAHLVARRPQTSGAPPGVADAADRDPEVVDP